MRPILILLLIGLLAATAFCAEQGLDAALDISKSGVIANNIKMKVHAENIANVDTTHTQNGGPFRRKIAVYEALGGQGLLQNELTQLKGVRISSVVEDQSALTKVFDPTHPDADSQGFVYFPNVNLAQEIVDLDQTNGNFQSNVTAFNITKQMMRSTLELGR